MARDNVSLDLKDVDIVLNALLGAKQNGGKKHATHDDLGDWQRTMDIIERCE